MQSRYVQCSSCTCASIRGGFFFFFFVSCSNIEMHSACRWLHFKNLLKTVTECKPAVCLILLLEV